MTPRPRKPKTAATDSTTTAAEGTSTEVPATPPGPPLPPPTKDQVRAALRKYVENFYDFQERRIQTAGRTYRRPDGVEIQLHEVDVSRLQRASADLELAEKHALEDVAFALKQIGFYRDVLSDKVKYKGVGPTMAGVILSSFQIEREEMASQMWSFAGLAPVYAKRCKACHSVLEERDDGNGPSWIHRPERVFKKPGAVAGEPAVKLPKCINAGQPVGLRETYDSGQAMRPVKGEKLKYNKWLKMKLVGVLGPVILQTCSYHCASCDEKLKKNKLKDAPEDSFLHPDSANDCGYKPTLVAGSGVLVGAQVVRKDSPWRKFYDQYKLRKQEEGWGRSDAHRHAASIRYLIKQLLLQIWKDWRTYEGLPVRPSYQEQYLGHKHHATSAPPSDTQERDDAGGDGMDEAAIAAAIEREVQLVEESAD